LSLGSKSHAKERKKMGNSIVSVSEENDFVMEPRHRLLIRTVGVTEMDRNLEVVKKIWMCEDLDRNVVSGGLMINEREMNQIWHVYDTDHNGVMDEREALLFLRDLLTVLEKREIENCRKSLENMKFKKELYQKNGWNFKQASIDLKEYMKNLPNIFKTLNGNISQIFLQMDIDQDGVISYNDFLVFCKEFNVNSQRKLFYGLLPNEMYTSSAVATTASTNIAQDI